MKFISAVFINIKKLKHRTSKAMYLILPITLLMALSVIITSQAGNIQTALNIYVFDKIKDQNTILQVTYQQNQANAAAGTSNRTRNTFTSQTGFTDADLAKMQAITNVSAASIDYALPISNITTSDLFSNKTIKLNQVLALNENLAGIYTKENFTYTEGETVPIIVNPNTFVQTVEDWGGKDSISFDFEALRKAVQTTSTTDTATPQSNPINSISPIKTSALEYNKDELIGKTFTIKFGGFSDIADYTTTRNGTTTTFTKLTADEIATDLASRKTVVSTYWDYDKLAAGVTYTFKVVGVIEDSTGNNSKTYVPESFAKLVTSKYIETQVNARTSATLATTLLNSTYTGTTYDGTELLSSTNFGGGQRGAFGGPGAGMGRPGEFTAETSTDSYAIPGLVIQVDSSNTSTVTGLVTDTKIFDTSAKRGNSITLKIKTLFDRTQVIKDLNSSGYAFQDINNLEVLNQIQNTLNQVSSGVVIGFILITIAVITLTMSKFVSESKKEIGIFRAVGFTKANILTIYLLQGIMYTFVGYIIGLGIGILGNLAISSVVYNWFLNFVTTTINKTVTITTAIDSTIFNGISTNSIIILSGLLLTLTIIISFFPALNASSISPVEAIKE